jgi:hypothetical protein
MMTPVRVPNAEPETPSERVALVVWWLAHGQCLTTRQISSLTGLTDRGSRLMVERLSRVIPIYSEDGEVDGRRVSVWQACVCRDERGT